MQSWGEEMDGKEGQPPSLPLGALNPNPTWDRAGVLGKEKEQRPQEDVSQGP